MPRSTKKPLVTATSVTAIAVVAAFAVLLTSTKPHSAEAKRPSRGSVHFGAQA